MNSSIRVRSSRSGMGLLILAGLAASSRAAGPDQQKSWVDRDRFPEAYSILTSDRVMFPDNVSDWPLKIDSSHQLFIDDYVMSEIEGLTRQFHQPTKYSANPIIKGRAIAVLYDAEKARLRMWAMGGRHLISTDGIHWEDAGKSIFAKIVYNPDLPEEEGRFKAVAERRYNAEADEPGGFYLYHSRDGLTWEQRPQEPILQRTVNCMLPAEFRPTGAADPSKFQWTDPDRFQTKGIGDTSTVRYDPVLKRYIWDGKIGLYLPPEKVRELGLGMDGKDRLRLRTICESEDLIHWSPPRFMMFPDRLDPPDRQIYSHVGFVYESMWVGMVHTMRVQKTGWKQVDLQLSYSRDGRHWLRPEHREPFIALGDDDSWEADYSIAVHTAPVLLGEELLFYYMSSRNPARDNQPESNWPMDLGLAKLRRDGFASLNAGEKPGQIVTRPLTFNGKHLFVNAEVGEGGWVKAAVLSRDSEPVAGCTLDEAVALLQGTTQGRMTWTSKDMLDPPGDDHLRIAFQLKNAKLYSFWIE